MKPSIVIIDYKSGNLRSAMRAFEKVAGDSAEIRVSDDPKTLEMASHIVLPGVGAFADCMKGIASIPGLIAKMEEQVLGKKKPFLGICVGMQLLAEKGYEHGVHQGLGWVKGEVKEIEKSAPDLKIPHMGWNDLIIGSKHPLLEGIKTGDHAYFVHSYHFAAANQDEVIAEIEYGGKITAAIARENIFGTQFHPEKSQEMGLKLIRNFLSLSCHSQPSICHSREGRNDSEERV